MTSKEAYENIGLALKCYLPDNLSKDTKDELQESWDIIRKDLEILDIFKSLGFELQTTILGSNLFFSTYLKSALLTAEQYVKLKEWSENNELDISHRKLDDEELEILHKVYSFKWE